MLLGEFLSTEHAESNDCESTRSRASREDALFESSSKLLSAWESCEDFRPGNGGGIMINDGIIVSVSTPCGSGELNVCSVSSNETLADDTTPDKSSMVGSSWSSESASREFRSIDSPHQGEWADSDTVWNDDDREWWPCPSDAVMYESSSVDLMLLFQS